MAWERSVSYLKRVSTVLLAATLVAGCASSDGDGEGSPAGTTDDGTAVEEPGDGTTTTESETAASPEPASEPTTVRYAWQRGQDADVPLLLGEDLGLYEEQGVVFEKIPLGGGPATLSAVASDSADVMYTSLPVVANAYLEGVELNYFCGQKPRTPLHVFAMDGQDIPSHEEAGSWEEVVLALEGTRYGVPARGSNLELEMSALMTLAGGDPNSITFVPIGTGPEAIAAVSQGQVDALTAYPYLLQQITADGLGESKLELAADGPEELQEAFYAGWLAKPEWLEENPDVARGLCEAAASTYEAVVDPANEEAIRVILDEHFGLEEAVRDEVMSSGVLETFGTELSAEAVQAGLDFMMGAGALAEDAEVSGDDLVQPLGE